VGVGEDVCLFELFWNPHVSLSSVQLPHTHTKHSLLHSPTHRFSRMVVSSSSGMSSTCSSRKRERKALQAGGAGRRQEG